MWLYTLFPIICRMSFMAGIVIAAVLLARLPLRRVPKIFSYMLWSVALPIRVASVIWILGLEALLLYNGISLLRLRRRLAGAVRIRENIYEIDQVESPFVFGIICPRIYLPTTLQEKETDYIILHERTHIRRGDHIVKLISFLALVLHWFNPLVWLAFFLSERDMEMSCDESVMKHMNGDIRAEYAASLLSLATGERRIAGAPLAFGEGGTKERVKNIMHYKKPTAAVIVVGLLAVLFLLAILGSNPKETEGTMFLLTNPAGGIEEVTATCFALDGSMVKLNMIQPYGEDGIWIPQTYGVTTKVGKAVDGSGNSETWFVGW